MISHVIYIGIILFEAICCFAYKYHSEHDMLTGIYNREWLFGQSKSHKNKLIRLMERTKRTGVPFGALFIDLDHFKEINDKKGHTGGDLILTKVSSILKNIASRYGLDAIREGGDEFVVIVPCAEKLKEIALEILYQVNMQTPITASIGGTVFRKFDKVNQENFLNIIDGAMYFIKNTGRNGVKIAAAECELCK